MGHHKKTRSSKQDECHTKRTKSSHEKTKILAELELLNKKISHHEKFKVKNASQKNVAKSTESWVQSQMTSPSVFKKRDESLLILKQFSKSCPTNFKIPSNRAIDRDNITTKYLQAIRNDEKVPKRFTSTNSTVANEIEVKLDENGTQIQIQELVLNDDYDKVDDERYPPDNSVLHPRMISPSSGSVSSEDQDILTLCVDEDDSWLYLPIPPRKSNFRFGST